MKLYEKANAELRGLDQASWLARMEQERNNIRAVLEWSLNEPERMLAGTKVLTSLLQFWQLSVDNEEWSYWYDLALTKSTDTPIPVRAKLLEGKGFQSLHQGAYEPARHYFDQSSALYMEAGDKRGVGRVLMYQAHSALGLDDTDQALVFALKSLEIHRQEGDQFFESAALLTLGDVVYLQGKLRQAQANYEESLSLAEDRWAGFAVARRRIRVGQAALALLDYSKARKFLIDGLTLASQVNDNWGVAMALAGFGCLAKAQGQPIRASKLLGATQGQLDAFGSRLWPMDQHEYDLAVASVRQILGQDSFSENWKEGRAMTMEEAKEYAAELNEPDIG